MTPTWKDPVEWWSIRIRTTGGPIAAIVHLAMDIRQTFNFTAVARTPWFNNHILNLIASIRGLSPIVRITVACHTR